MGLIDRLLGAIFGDGRNVIAETAEVFRVNAERSDARAVEVQLAALAQLAQEFETPRKGLFDRLIDGLNRIPRPAMALGTLALFLSAMVNPVWFSERMQGIALVPEPLWWLLGAIVSFYFGARHQAKGQEFQRSLAAAMARAPQVVENLAELRRLSESKRAATADPAAALEAGAAWESERAVEADAVAQATRPEENPALEAWEGRRLERARGALVERDKVMR